MSPGLWGSNPSHEVNPVCPLQSTLYSYSVSAAQLGWFLTVSFSRPFFLNFFYQSWVRRQEHLWDKADRMRNSHVFGPMIHELFNEDLGNLPRQLKGPYGFQQLLPMTSERTWRSWPGAVTAIVWLYGGYAPKRSENMQHQNFTRQFLDPSVWLNRFPLLSSLGDFKECHAWKLV